MKFCYEKKEACCCVPISNATCAFLFHLIIHGGVIAIYVFTTFSDPPLYYIDYFFGIMGLTLSGISFFTVLFVRVKKCQCFRGFMGLLMVLAIIGNIIGTFWYSVERWNAVMKTLVLDSISPSYKASDPIWYIWLVCCWFVALLSIYYLVCIMSCMCNPYNTYLFTNGYVTSFNEPFPQTTVEVSRYTERYRHYKPYPVQKSYE